MRSQKKDCLVGKGKKYIHVNSSGHTKKPRDVEIPNSLIRDIKNYLVFLNNMGLGERSQYLLFSERSNKLSVSGLWSKWKKYTKYRLQNARCAYGRYLFDTTFNSQFVRQQMGLSKRSTVFYYLSDEHVGLNREGLKNFETTLDVANKKKKSPEKPLPEKEPSLALKQKDKKIPYVYIIEANGVYKIGSSKNVSQRISSIQTHCPFPIKTVLVLLDDGGTENKLHEQFEKQKIHGEWFNLKKKDVKTIIKDYDSKIEWISKF